jgi:hypothetical protein
MTDPQEPRGTPTWVNVLLIILAVIIIGFGACFVLISDLAI